MESPRTVWIAAQVLAEREGMLIVQLEDGFGQAHAVIHKDKAREEADGRGAGLPVVVAGGAREDAAMDRADAARKGE